MSGLTTLQTPASTKILHDGIDLLDALHALLPQHLEEALEHISHGSAVVRSPVMVEIRETQSVSHDIQFVFAQLRHQILGHDECIQIGWMELQTQALTAHSQKGHIKIRVVGSQRPSCTELQKLRQYLFKCRRVL